MGLSQSILTGIDGLRNREVHSSNCGTPHNLPSGTRRSRTVDRPTDGIRARQPLQRRTSAIANTCVGTMNRPKRTLSHAEESSEGLTMVYVERLLRRSEGVRLVSEPAASPPEEGVIDVWAQIPDRRFAGQAWLEPLRRWTGRTVDDLTSTVEQTVSAMDGNGVDLVLLSAWRGPEGWLITNDDVARAIDAEPGRFRGLASVDLADPVGAVRTIRLWWTVSVSLGSAWCRGCEACRRTTAGTTPSTPRVSSAACPSVFRSATPARCGSRKQDVSSRTSRTSCWTSPSSS